jgi:hypothetical protein
MMPSLKAISMMKKDGNFREFKLQGEVPAGRVCGEVHGEW